MSSADIKFVPKTWGFEKWIANSELYCGKLLYVSAGQRCSWHYHKLKDETFYIQEGMVTLITGPSNDTKDAENITLGVGAAYHMPREQRHQFIAVVDTIIFEFSTQHFEEDSYRISK